MVMLPEVVDGVIGADTHRDTNQVEIARPSGAAIATRSFSNDSVGHAEALAWVFEHAPGPRLVLSIEGTRSYGAGLARAATAAGISVIEAEQPTRKTRRGKGKSDPMDAHLLCCTPCNSTPKNCPLLVLMATARPCGFCCAPARS